MYSVHCTLNNSLFIPHSTVESSSFRATDGNDFDTVQSAHTSRAYCTIIFLQFILTIEYWMYCRVSALCLSSAEARIALFASPLQRTSFRRALSRRSICTPLSLPRHSTGSTRCVRSVPQCSFTSIFSAFLTVLSISAAPFAFVFYLSYFSGYVTVVNFTSSAYFLNIKRSRF